MRESLLYKPIFHILLITLIGLVAYSNTLHIPFHFDDERNITDNPVIKELHIFLEPSKVKNYAGSMMYQGLKHRFIGYLSFALNYKIHGLDVVGYHIFNILVHIINALLVYWLVLLTFKTLYLSGAYVHKNLSNNFHSVLIALFSALFFVSHPIQTQAVTYIVRESR